MLLPMVSGGLAVDAVHPSSVVTPQTHHYSELIQHFPKHCYSSCRTNHLLLTATFTLLLWIFGSEMFCTNAETLNSDWIYKEVPLARVLPEFALAGDI